MAATPPKSEATAASSPSTRRTPTDPMMGAIAATRGEATRAAEAATEILAILTQGDAHDPILMIESLLKGIAEQGVALQRIEEQLMRIEARLPEAF